MVLSDQNPKQMVSINGKDTIHLVLHSSTTSHLAIAGQNLFCLVLRDVSPSHLHWMNTSSSSSSIYYHDGFMVCDMQCSLPIPQSSQPISYTIQIIDGNTIEMVLEKRETDGNNKDEEEQISREQAVDSAVILCPTCGKSIGKNVYQVYSM